MHSISDRLRHERDRLGLSQQALADACSISLRSQQNYEKGERSPDADYLAAIAALGFDVLYVLTGHRGAPVAPPAPALTAEQKALLDRYERADPISRKMAQRVLSPDPDQTAVKKVGRRGSKAA